MKFVSIGLLSLWNRRYTAGLTILTIAISAALLIGVEKVRHNAKTSFANTVSGVDLIVGARSGAIPLLLYSVFRIGNATNNITMESYQHIATQPGVKWTIPISLGDSHRGYRVMGTNQAYFEHYRVGQQRKLTFSHGAPFSKLFDVVVGAEVAKSLGYKLDDKIIIAHGIGNTSFATHDDKPFVISGILDPTGTPVDRTVHVSLAAIEAIHIGWEQGVQIPGASASLESRLNPKLQPTAITAFMVGLQSRVGVFKLQRLINEYREEPLLAILPGVALQELWSFMFVAEQAMWVISLFVAVAAFLGMIAVSLAGLNERRREIAVFRAVGASVRYICALLIVETIILTVSGLILGMVILYLGLWILRPLIEANFGLYIPIGLPTPTEIALLLGLLGIGVLSGIVPAFTAYRNTLVDGLTAKT